MPHVGVFDSQKVTASLLGTAMGSVNEPSFVGPLGSCFSVAERLICRFRIGEAREGLPVLCAVSPCHCLLCSFCVLWMNDPRNFKGSKEYQSQQ